MRRFSRTVPVFTRLSHSRLLLAAGLFLYALVPASTTAQSDGEQEHILWTLSEDGLVVMLRDEGYTVEQQ